MRWWGPALAIVIAVVLIMAVAIIFITVIGILLGSSTAVF